VSEVPRDAPPPTDGLAYAIQEAEEVRDYLERRDATVAHERVVTTYSAMVAAVPEERSELEKVIVNAPVTYKGSQAGDEYEAALMNAKLRAAYDVRRRLGS
jgi:cation transport regulator ChaC